MRVMRDVQDRLYTKMEKWTLKVRSWWNTDGRTWSNYQIVTNTDEIFWYGWLSTDVGKINREDSLEDSLEFHNSDPGSLNWKMTSDNGILKYDDTIYGTQWWNFYNIQTATEEITQELSLQSSDVAD